MYWEVRSSWIAETENESFQGHNSTFCSTEGHQDKGGLGFPRETTWREKSRCLNKGAWETVSSQGECERRACRE